jgi:hypothetical protein
MPTTGGVALPQTDFPRARLTNGEIEVSILLPDAERGYYRGTRFDWSGIIEHVHYRGHSFYGPLHAEHDPYRHDAVSGPADEFAMFNPMGFAEAGPGDSFVKIGVGLLAKGTSEEYLFDGDYRLRRPGIWRMEQGGSWIGFEQVLDGERGWAYRYRKTIRLPDGEPGFAIDYRLENSGTKAVDINHYNHNFTLIDGLPYGPDYLVEFAFSTGEPQLINDLAWFRDGAIQVDRPLGDQSLWIQLYEGPGRMDYNAATVRNQITGAAVSFEGDAPIERMVFWAVERAACPEPFSRIRLDPGEAKTWSSSYRFSAD